MSQFTFTHQWFHNLTAKLWSRYLLPHKAGIDRYLEIGVAEGQSLIWVLQHLLDDKPAGYAVGVDPFLDARNWHHGEGDAHKVAALGNISAMLGRQEIRLYYTDQRHRDFKYWRWPLHGDGPMDALESYCEIQPYPSQEYLLRERREFDLAYVDGNHDAQNALLDILLAYNLLRDGGILVIDDYERHLRGGRPQVRPAVDAFEITHHGLFDPIYRHPKQVAFVKRAKRRRRREYPPMLEAVPAITPTGDTE